MYYFNKVENTSVKVENSNKKSTVNISYKGWETLNDKIDLTTKLEIFLTKDLQKLPLPLLKPSLAFAQEL
jgi:archaellum component FlaF (FlaF/FlaG flagellin family)